MNKKILKKKENSEKKGILNQFQDIQYIDNYFRSVGLIEVRIPEDDFIYKFNKRYERQLDSEAKVKIWMSKEFK